MAVLDAILYVVHSGCAWLLLPHGLPVVAAEALGRALVRLNEHLHDAGAPPQRKNYELRYRILEMAVGKAASFPGTCKSMRVTLGLDGAWEAGGTTGKTPVTQLLAEATV